MKSLIPLIVGLTLSTIALASVAPNITCQTKQTTERPQYFLNIYDGIPLSIMLEEHVKEEQVILKNFSCDEIEAYTKANSKIYFCLSDMNQRLYLILDDRNLVPEVSLVTTDLIIISSEFSCKNVL